MALLEEGLTSWAYRNDGLEIDMFPGQVVMRGSYLYDGSVSCELCIVFIPVRYGTGDYQDDPEIGEDAQIDTYYLYYTAPVSATRFNVGGGGHPSLAEAMAAAESAPGIGATVRWDQQSVETDCEKPSSG